MMPLPVLYVLVIVIANLVAVGAAAFGPAWLVGCCDAAVPHSGKAKELVMRTVGDRLKDADAWWKSGPKVSNTLRERVQRYGLYQALDMTFGFEWRFADADFPPPRGRLLSGLLGTARRLIPRRIIPSRRNPARGTDTA